MEDEARNKKSFSGGGGDHLRGYCSAALPSSVNIVSSDYAFLTYAQ